MLIGCLQPVLRVALGLLAATCNTLVLLMWWLGPHHTTVWLLDRSLLEEFDLAIGGHTPDLQLVLWRRDLPLGASTEVVHVILRAQPVALATIALCLLLITLDWLTRHSARR